MATRCISCKKKIGLNGINCKWCSKHFCVTCLNPSVHCCEFMDKLKNSKKDILECKLNVEKTVDNKNYIRI